MNLDVIEVPETVQQLTPKGAVLVAWHAALRTVHPMSDGRHLCWIGRWKEGRMPSKEEVWSAMNALNNPMNPMLEPQRAALAALYELLFGDVSAVHGKVVWALQAAQESVNARNRPQGGWKPEDVNHLELERQAQARDIRTFA